MISTFHAAPEAYILTGKLKFLGVLECKVVLVNLSHSEDADAGAKAFKVTE